MRDLPKEQGPGNALLVTLELEQLTEVFTSFGERGVSAEQVAAQLCPQVRDYFEGGAPVGPYLADQLLPPRCMAGDLLVTRPPSPHTRTNPKTIEAFLPGLLSLTESRDGTAMIQSSGPGDPVGRPPPG